MKRFWILLFSLMLIGCSPPVADATPAPNATLSLPSASQTPPPPTQAPVIATATTMTGPSALTGTSGAAAVILVGEGDVLNVRSDAGIENPVIESFAANATGLTRTGQTQLVGEETWAEVQTSTTGTGWVNARYLTEYVSMQQFCMDSQVQFLLDNLKIAFQNEDGQLFSALVSPIHGLDLRYYRYGTLANYSLDEAAWVFQSTYEVDWGDEPGSGFEKLGTFSEIPLPVLKEVFGSLYELSCNDVGVASAFAQEPWPPEYTNINFYNIFKPGTDQYGGLDWRLWLLGVEYVNGKPYLFALIHFQWEP
jgi:hypothetical protein